MKEQTVWILWYVILGGLPLIVAGMALKDLMVGSRARIQQRTKR